MLVIRRIGNGIWQCNLYKFEITLYEGVRSIGNAKYSATGLDLRKFGPAEEKIRPVLKELFAR